VGSIPSLTAAAGTRCVKLTWTQSTSDVAVERFEVERRLDPTGQWVRIGTTSGSVHVVTDTSVDNRRTYSYRVRLLDALGRTSAYSAEATARPKATIVRHAGSDRTRTAVAASVSAFDSGSSATVVLASSAGYADALSAAGLAGAVRGPVLLVGRYGFNTDLRNEVSRLGTTHVIIVGGSAAVPERVANDIRAAGMTVERVAGADRYATAASVALRLQKETGCDPEEAFIVTGGKFADALSVSSVAYARRSPILLTKPTSLPKATLDALRVIQAKRTVIVGGTAAVSTAVQGQVRVAGAADVRLAGADRYATAARFTSWAVDEGLAQRRVLYVATGIDFPDALGAGPAAGARGGLLLLTDNDELSAPIRAAIDSAADDVDAVEIIGGTGAVRSNVVDAIDHLLQ
jgi:putative cell wall-binding protein